MTYRTTTIILLVILLGLLTACGGVAESSTEIKLAPKSALPDFAKDAPPQVQEAYQFAVANPEILQQMPCYCGCGAMGHQNNYQCYIKEVHADGSLEFENHAFGWSICVDITRDVMRLLEEGQDLKDIRAYIDAEYSQYGPSTNTEPISDTPDTCSDTVETCGQPNEGEQVLNPDARAPVTVSESQPN